LTVPYRLFPTRLQIDVVDMKTETKTEKRWTSCNQWMGEVVDLFLDISRITSQLGEVIYSY